MITPGTSPTPGGKGGPAAATDAPPVLLTDPDVRRARLHARYRALYLARRAAWRASAGDPARYRAAMAAWISAGKPPPPL
ncbi:hypothetical protein [Actinomadura opuntiae]|uniref:hypothetical protein n=1 Tax=Actinomadura sp. OS1-43 TaxID=604315 RepID=UPI00255AAEF8|nr:hypothetical protein [Actinomadura sp. OS1-43]MDL4812847.1 hypothetical protein [Actinomadura sp. OS1-43]